MKIHEIVTVNGCDNDCEVAKKIAAVLRSFRLSWLNLYHEVQSSNH